MIIKNLIEINLVTFIKMSLYNNNILKISSLISFSQKGYMTNDTPNLLEMDF